MRRLVIDGVAIADDAPCYVIAEVGHNHQGDLAQAKRLVDAAKECGASAVKLQKPEAPPEPVRSYSKDTIDKWTKLIGDKVETSGKNDQLTMIHIQELKATLDQGSQLASTFISSGDKTSSSIIGNIA